MIHIDSQTELRFSNLYPFIVRFLSLKSFLTVLLITVLINSRVFLLLKIAS